MKLTPKMISPRIFATASLLLLAACSQPAVPEDHYYRINISNTIDAGGLKLNGTVEVERFIADGLLDSRPILFAASSNSAVVQSYHYHFWTQPPSIMLQNALVAKLQQANAAKSVVTPNLRIEPDFVISGKIFKFEHIKNSAGNKAYISLELNLKNSRTDTLHHLNTYSIEVPARNASVPAAVAAFSIGIDKIIAKFLQDIIGKI